MNFIKFFVAAGAASLVAVSAPAWAAPELTQYPANVGCSFPLTFVTDPDLGSQHEIKKKEKRGVLTTIKVGSSAPVTFTNATTGATYTVKGKGGNLTTDVVSNGDTILTFSGHYVLIWFPEDHPTGPGSAGPETNLNIGHVVVRISGEDGTWTLIRESGTKADICALLS
jgi:hypothetical protein